MSPAAHIAHARFSWRAVAASAAAAGVAVAIAVALSTGGGSTLSAPLPPGQLTAGEQAAVAAAQASDDVRLRRIAGSVARGEAGSLSLADPALLAHHRLDTSVPDPGALGELAAARYHHR